MPREEKNPDRVILREFTTCHGCGEENNWLVQNMLAGEIETKRVSPITIKGVRAALVLFKDDEFRKKEGTTKPGDEFYALQVIEDTCEKCGRIQVIRHERLRGRYTQKTTIAGPDLTKIHLPPGVMRKIGGQMPPIDSTS